MTDIAFYNEHVAPLIAMGVTDDAQLAGLITAKSSRYPHVPMTVNEIAVALTDRGNADADGIVTRLMDSLAVAAQTSFLVKNKLEEVSNVDNPGYVDVGSYLQRAMLQTFAVNPALAVEQADVDALLALTEVPPPVTVQDILDAKQAKVDDDAAKAAEQAAADALAAIRSANDDLRQAYITSQSPIDAIWNTDELIDKEDVALALEAQATAIRAS